MATRPSVIPRIDTTSSNRSAPTAAQISTGFTTSHIFEDDTANYLFGYTGDWLVYADQACVTNDDQRDNASARVRGMAWTGSGLTLNMSAGVALVDGDRTVVSATSNAFTDEATTYVGVNNAGTISYSSALTLGAAPPTPAAGVVWFERIDATGGNAAAVSVDADRRDGTLPIGVMPSRSVRIERDATGYDPRLELYSDEASGRVEIVLGVDEGKRCVIAATETTTVFEVWDGTAKTADAISINNATGAVTMPATVETTEDEGNTGATITVDFADSKFRKATLDDDAAITLATPGDGVYHLLLVQAGSGGNIPTWVNADTHADVYRINALGGEGTLCTITRLDGNYMVRAERVGSVPVDPVQYLFKAWNGSSWTDGDLTFDDAVQPGNSVVVIGCGNSTIAVPSGFTLVSDETSSSITLVAGYHNGKSGLTDMTPSSTGNADGWWMAMELEGQTTALTEGVDGGSSVTSVTTTGAATTTAPRTISIAAVAAEDAMTGRSWSSHYAERSYGTDTQASMAVAMSSLKPGSDPDFTFSHTGTADGMRAIAFPLTLA